MAESEFIFLEDQNHANLANILIKEQCVDHVRLTSTGVGIVYNYALEATGRIDTGNIGTSRQLTHGEFFALHDRKAVTLIFPSDPLTLLPIRDKTSLALTTKGERRRMEVEREMREQGLL